jgi:hypothetical protein
MEVESAVIPSRRAVMADHDPLSFASQLAKLAHVHAPILPDSTVNPARWMHGRIVQSIIDFEAALDETQEIGARLVNFGEREPIHITDVSYMGPHLVIFHGTNLDGRPVQLLQHVTQVSVLLVALPKEHERPRRIGFDLQQKLDPPAQEKA